MFPGYPFSAVLELKKFPPQTHSIRFPWGNLVSWTQTAIDQLSEFQTWNYPNGRTSFTEPAAFSALALLQAGRIDEAKHTVDWIASIQQQDGRIGVSEVHTTPAWTTSLAILAWQRFQQATQTNRFADPLRRALNWAGNAKGSTIDPKKATSIGHDTTLVGWPWVIGTHSWIEPTAFFVMAFHATERTGHARTRDAVRLLIDRQLPSGGCNYGNTLVLGNVLKPHPQPSGISLMALAPFVHQVDSTETEIPLDRKSKLAIKQSANYLRSQIDQPLGTASRCFVTLGLAAQTQQPVGLAQLEQTYRQRVAKNLSAYQLALCLLANEGDHSILFDSFENGEPNRSTT